MNMKISVLSKVVMALALALIAWQPRATAQTWSNNYAYRRAITIDHTKVSNTDQSNFPVLISGTYSYLATIANGGNVTSASGYDIIFTSDAGGTTTLAYERESYSPTTGAVLLWVKLPTLSHTTDTVIYMFYGNGSISSDQSSKTAVWDSNYLGVYHLGDNSANATVSDSTSNGNNGTAAANTSTKTTTGELGSALNFNGSSDKVTTALTRTTAFTWEAWLNNHSGTGYQSVITIDGSNYVLMDLNGTTGSFWSIDGLSGNSLSVSVPSTNTWHHLVFVRSGNSSSTGYSAYFDGALKGQTSSGTLNSGNTITFGFRPDYTSQAWNGALDEIRISNVARSADWVAVEYNNETSPSTFYSVGSADTTGSGGTPTPNIANLSPSSGPVTTLVTITGTNFGPTQGSSTVTFNGTTASPTTWTGAGIVARVPSGAMTGNVVVTVSGVASSGSNFTVTSAPAIATITPQSGLAGSSVTITGANFGTTQGTSTVKFNGTAATVLSWSASSIVARTAATTTTGNVVVNVGGVDSNGVPFTVLSLSSGWTDLDVGPSGTAGSASYATDTFTINSAGTGIGPGNGNNATIDGFNFVYQQLSGDASIVARVTGLQGLWASQAGIMIRETLNQSSTNAALTVESLSSKYLYWWNRPSTGASEANPNSAAISLPLWIKLVRQGNNFSAYTAPDGINWLQFGSTVTINMAQSAYIGLVCDGGNSGANAATCNFDNVSISPGPTITTLSATTGPIGSQVIISGSGFGATQGDSQVTLNTALVTVNSWSETSITITIPSGATSGHVVVTVAPSMNDSNPVEFTITGNPLPAGWLDWDIGPAGAPGTATYSSGVFTLKSAGTGLGGVNSGSTTVDGLHFVYKPLPGSGEIVARFDSLTGGATSQAGLMIRETLDESATNVFLTVLKNTSTYLYLYDRTSPGTSEANPISASLNTVPMWLKLVRSGSTFSAYTSPDGVNWTQFGSNIAITMAQNAYIGIASTGGNNGANLSTSTFDYVSVSTTATSAPVIGSMSATTGAIGSQVVLSGSGFGASQGSSYVTLNGTVATINSWSDTSITITIPAGATTGFLVVTVAPSMNNSNAMVFEVTSSPLPVGWLDQDIGAVGLAGGSTYSNGTFTIQGAGLGVGGTGSGFLGPWDSFHFVYQRMSGDGSIIARVVSEPGTTGQAGILIRQTIEDIAPPNAFVSYFPQNTNIVFWDRTTENANESSIANTSSVSLPYWVKLVRSGNMFSAYAAADGMNWVQIGTSQSISMSQNLYVGLGVSSHITSSLATATFDNVSVSSTQVPGPMITAVSSTSGSIGSQVVITGSGFGNIQSSSQVLLNGVATTVNSWTQTSITITIPTGATSGPLVVSVAPSMNNSNAVQFTVTANPLPSGWLDQDVGLVGVAGNASYSSGTGTFTLNASGSGVGGVGGNGYSGPQDAFHFVYQPLAGNGTIIARIVTNPGTTGQAGVMIRQSLDAGALNVFLANFPQVHAASVFDRASTGSNEDLPANVSMLLSYWVKVVRNGATFSCFVSNDGSSWSQVGSSLSIPMSQNVYVGLGMSSGINSTLGSATFDNVSMTFSGWGTSPTITSVTPISGATGTSVTISGSNFGSTQGMSTVTFNGTTATPCGTCWSASSITVTVPTGATTGNVLVTVGGVASNGVSFGVFNPVISSLSPATAQARASITVNGSGFGANQSNSTVQFNGVPASVITWSDTRITVQVPTNATSGPVTINENGVVSNGVQFSVENLSITGISQSSAPAGSSVTITGTGFGSTQATGTVDFYGTPATVQSWSDTQIVAVVPSWAASGSVNVSVGGLVWYGPQFTLTRTVQVTDSLSNVGTYTSAMIGGLWVPTTVQGSGCSSCTERGNISYTYDSSGHPLSRTDENGNTTTYTHDANGNVLTLTVPLTSTTSATTSYTYNSFGEVLTATGALGNVTTNTYDANGNLLTVTTPAPNGNTAASVTRFAYDAKGELTTITDPLNHQTTITYFPTGLIQTITDAQSHVTTYAYDSRGNRTSVTDANNKQTTFNYDAMNRLTKITYSDTTTTQFGYDYRGRRTSVTDQNGKVTTYAYDDADRLTSVTDAANNVTTYAYDTENNLTSITDANQHATSFNYDAFGRVTKTTFPSSAVETYAYDSVGNLTGKTDRKNQTINYAYDLSNRLTQKTYPDSTTVNYTYDNDSRLTQVTDPTGTYQFTFDNMGRLTGTTTSYSFLTGRNFTTAYTYDAASNRTGFTDPEGGSTTYAYDTLNRLQTLTPPSAFTTGNFGFSYDTLSRRTQMTRPNNVTTNYAYDDLSRLTSVLHQLSGSTIDGATYTVDNAGNRTSKTDQRTAVATSYGYDNIYQLPSATQGATTTESYTYDPVGNRLSSLGVSSYTNNSSNELMTTSNASYGYDNNGNTATKNDSTGITTYAWDYENRLTSITLPGSGGTVSFKYDPLGRRIYKSSSSGTSVFAYDVDNLVEETNSGGAVVARYSQGLNVDEPLAMLRSGTTSFYHTDGLGSVTSLANSSGTLAQTYTFDSFGKRSASSGSLTNPFQYTARESDMETGLYYYRARYYDANTGRFLSEDPIGFNGGLNFYSYTQNRPIGLRDPSGKCVHGIDTIICIAVGVGAVAIYTGYLNYENSVNNLINLAYNNRAAIQNVLTKCYHPERYSTQACQDAIDLAAQTECALYRGVKRVGFAGFTLPGTIVGGDFPSSKWDLLSGAIQDQITKKAEQDLEKAEKNSKNGGCGCH